MKTIITIAVIVTTLLSCKKETHELSNLLTTDFRFVVNDTLNGEMFAVVYGDKVEYIPISDSMSVNLNLFLTENKTVRVEVFQKDDIYNYLYLGEVTLNKDSTLTIEEINNSILELERIGRNILISY